MSAESSGSSFCIFLVFLEDFYAHVWCRVVRSRDFNPSPRISLCSKLNLVAVFFVCFALDCANIRMDQLKTYYNIVDDNACEFCHLCVSLVLSSTRKVLVRPVHRLELFAPA